MSTFPPIADYGLKIKAEVLDKGVSSRGVFRQHYKTDDLDASLLLLPIMGFLPPDDERIKATVLAIADELTENGLVLRYRVEGTDTGFAGEEGTFTICSFWLVTALAMIGETGPAHAFARSCCPSPGRCCSMPRKSIPPPASTWATSRRRSPTWRSSRPCQSSSSWSQAGASPPPDRRLGAPPRVGTRRKAGMPEADHLVGLV